MLEERGRQWQQHFPRAARTILPTATATRPKNRSAKSSCGISSARLAASSANKAAASPSNIVYDDTPIEVYMQRIHANCWRRGKIAIPELFQPHNEPLHTGRSVPRHAGACPTPRRATWSRANCSKKFGFSRVPPPTTRWMSPPPTTTTPAPRSTDCWTRPKQNPGRKSKRKNPKEQKFEQSRANSFFFVGGGKVTVAYAHD